MSDADSVVTLGETLAMRMALLAALTLTISPLAPVAASVPRDAWVSKGGIEALFSGAQKVDLRTSQIASVVRLREDVKIPPPEETVLVKTFCRDSLPEPLLTVFCEPDVRGVTIGGRFIAIIETEFPKEHLDVLAHELVHAYITLASPRPLPVWFQEGSAVHFSINQGSKVYAKASEDLPGVTVGRKVELPEFYKNKLQSFHFLIERVGEHEFYKWYRNAVVSGEVNARPLLGLKPESNSPAPHKPIPVWTLVFACVAVVVVATIGYSMMRRERDLW